VAEVFPPESERGGLSEKGRGRFAATSLADIAKGQSSRIKVNPGKLSL
jgi:hypothetical protein